MERGSPFHYILLPKATASDVIAPFLLLARVSRGKSCATPSPFSLPPSLTPEGNFSMKQFSQQDADIMDKIAIQCFSEEIWSVPNIATNSKNLLCIKSSQFSQGNETPMVREGKKGSDE